MKNEIIVFLLNEGEEKLEAKLKKFIRKQNGVVKDIIFAEDEIMHNLDKIFKLNIQIKSK